MARTGDAVAEHSGKRQIRLEGGQAMSQGAKGLGHGRTVDHAQHRHAEVTGQIGRRRFAVEQTHDPFDQDQIGLARGLPQQPAALRLTHHGQVELVHRRAAGTGVDHRIEKVRAALEHPHPTPLTRMQARQRGGDGGLTLTRSRRSNQQRRAVTCFHQNSMPFCAFTPDLNACLTRLISVTVSAASIIPGNAPRPVTTTCCNSGRASISASTGSSSR